MVPEHIKRNGESAQHSLNNKHRVHPILTRNRFRTPSVCIGRPLWNRKSHKQVNLMPIQGSLSRVQQSWQLKHPPKVGDRRAMVLFRLWYCNRRTLTVASMAAAAEMMFSATRNYLAATETRFCAPLVVDMCAIPLTRTQVGCGIAVASPVLARKAASPGRFPNAERKYFRW